MQNLLFISVSSNLVDCVAACPTECKITDFTASMSFSQLSSQATSILLGTQAEAIGEEYAHALELNYRLSYTNPFLDQVMKLSQLTKSSLDQIKGNLRLLEFVDNGLFMFNNQIVIADLEKLQQSLTPFQSVYNATFKTPRWRASKYVTDAFDLLHDLNFILLSQPAFYTNLYDAQRFYSLVASLLDSCSTSTRLANEYLIEAINLETKAKQPYFPDYFYKKRKVEIWENYPYFAEPCTDNYNVAFQTLPKLDILLNFAKQKVLLWLQTNAANIKNTTLNAFHQTSVDSITETPSSVSNAYETNTYDYTGAASNNHSEYFPGFWTLLECIDCAESINDTWFNLAGTLSSDVSYTISQCLVQYELFLAYALAPTFISLDFPPSFVTSDNLNYLLGNMSEQAKNLEEYTHSHIIGTLSGRAFSTLAGNILNNMSQSLSTVEQEITALLRIWESDVNSWNSYINSQYISICGSLSQLSRFLWSNTQLATGVASLSIWLQPRIIYSPQIALEFGVTDISGTRKTIESDLNSFINFAGETVAKSTMSSISNDIIENSGQIDQFVKDLSDYLSSQQTSVGELLSNFLNGFIIGNDFIRSVFFSRMSLF